jgi:hypothetical protein
MQIAMDIRREDTVLGISLMSFITIIVLLLFLFIVSFDKICQKCKLDKILNPYNQKPAKW